MSPLFKHKNTGNTLHTACFLHLSPSSVVFRKSIFWELLLIFWGYLGIFNLDCNTPLQYTFQMAKIPTVKLVLFKKYASDNEGYIKLKVWIPGSRTKFKLKSTKYKVLAQYWLVDEERVKKTCPDAETINREIDREKEELVEVFKDDLKKGKVFTANHIAARLAGNGNGGSFLKFYEDYIEYLETKFTADYITHVRGHLKKLAKFTNNELAFEDINVDFLEKYEVSMAHLAKTTMSTVMNRLKEVVDRAIARELISGKELLDYKWPRFAAPRPPYLTLEQTEKLGSLIYSGKLDYAPRIKMVACYFLVECYAGIRFSDWPRFEVEQLVHKRNLKVIAHKNGEPIYLPLDTFTRLGKIIDYMKEHRITFDAKEPETNSILKLLAMHEDLKFNIKLTTHIGRHTCGTLLGEMGYSTAEIAQVLGISEQTAKIYTERTRKGLEYAFSRHGGL